MRRRLHPATGLWLSGMVLLTVALVLPASAGAEQTPALSHPANPVPTGPVGSLQRPNAEQPLSAAEVLKLAEAGVSPEVLQSYVENAPAVRQPSPEDLITLKQHRVPDAVTTALIKRSAETRAAQAERVNRFLGQMRAQNSGSPGRLDPESYEYFQRYYLFPRTLSSVYDRLYYGEPPNLRQVAPYWW